MLNRNLLSTLASVAFVFSSSASAQTLTSAPTAQPFAQTAVSPSTPSSQTIGYSFTGSVAPSFSLHYGLEFVIKTTTCSGSTALNCSVTVSFSPRFPGLQQDALLVKNGSGVLLAATPLSGIGSGPQALMFPGIISSVAGNGSWGYSGDGNLARLATLRSPQAVAVDGAGNVFISDSINQCVREISASTGLMSTVAGSLNANYSGDGGLATRALLNNPAGLAIDGAGNLFIADQGNNVIRRVDAVTQIITTVAGGGLSPSRADGLGDGGPATSALLSGPMDVAVDAAGNLFIADSFHGLIRRVDAASGSITVVAGGGTAAGSDGFGDGLVATSAFLHDPRSIALDVAGNLFIAESGNSLVRRVDASSKIITAVAGTGANGYSGDNALAVYAHLGTPTAVRLDPAGNIYIADSAQNVVRQVNAATAIITTVAGLGAARYTGDAGAPTAATLSSPYGLAFDNSGNLYIADLGNNAVRKINLQPSPLTFPSTVVGQASPVQPVVITNAGNANLTVSALTFSGSFSQSLLNIADCNSNSVVSPAGSCTVGVQFVPLSAGNAAGSLTVRTNSLNASASHVFTLSGSGAAGATPALTLSTTSMNFGSLAVGASSTAQRVTVSNTGSAPLLFSGIALNGANAADFVLSTTCSTVVAAGANCTLSITFKPSAAGSKAASLVFYANVAGVPQVALTGVASGTPQAALNATALSFGSRAIGGITGSRYITLSNVGNAPLSITAVSLSGANAAEFSLSNSCGSSLAASASCALTISFNPRGLGLRRATLTVADNASASTLTVSLTGNAVAQSSPAVWRPSSGNWYVTSPKSTNPAITQWGYPGDIPVPGDYDGDGKMDIAVWRPSTGMWYIVPSSTGIYYAVQWGYPNDVPVVADYDGDGKADIAVWRPSTGMWYIVPSSTGIYYGVQWGYPTDVPVVADYDGDGKADIAVWRPSTGMWYIVPSSTGIYYGVQWGYPNDVPVVADYDGDGKADIAVWRPSTGMWYIVPSSTGIYYGVQWGYPNDVPVAADYDGDGKADIAVWRPSTGMWYIVPSSTGVYYGVQLGSTGDRALTRGSH